MWGGGSQFKILKFRAGEVAQRLRILVAFIEDLASVPNTSVSTDNHLSLQFQGI